MRPEIATQPAAARALLLLGRLAGILGRGFLASCVRLRRVRRIVTAEEIRARAREVRRERERIVPQARELLKARAADEAAVRSLYPAAFDAKSPDSRAYRAVFKAVPELRRLPNPHTLALQMLLGEKALAAHRAAPAKKAAPLPKKVPRAPGQGGGGKGSRVVHSDGKAATSDAVRNYTKGGGSRDALVAAATAFL